jgi:hypothetical protein
MRTTCENCGQLQPPDWQPGDLCVHCGTAVRREHRCYWCVKYTPEGKYCRNCGAGQIPAMQYAAARWLKHVGSDQFAIPLRLATMEAEQIAHFSQLYEAQGNVIAQHIQGMHFAESFLRQQGWAQAWEEDMLPRLPLPDSEIQTLLMPPLKGGPAIERLAEIRDGSPLSLARVLASLARLRLLLAANAPLEEEEMWLDLDNARDHLTDPDLALQTEAFLTLCHWRLLEQLSHSMENELRGAVYTALNGPFALEARTVSALVNALKKEQPQSVLPEALGSSDPDIAFAAALASHDSDALHAALRVPRRRFAAAHTLTHMRADFDLLPLLPGFTPQQLSKLLWTIFRQQQPRPDLRPFLLRIVEGKQPYEGADLMCASALLALDVRPGDVVDFNK